MYLVCQTIRLSDYWTVWLSGCQIIGLTSFNIGYLEFVLQIQVKLKGCENYNTNLVVWHYRKFPFKNIQLQEFYPPTILEPSTCTHLFLCLSQSRTWISNARCHASFCVQWFEVVVTVSLVDICRTIFSLFLFVIFTAF
jgi:hypothetical protein